MRFSGFSNVALASKLTWLKAVAIYHCRISEVQRSKGQNAVSAVAYISRSKLQFVASNGETGEQKVISYNYSGKDGLAHSIILAPDDSPDWVYDRQELWNRAERAETRKNAETARKMTIALPKELSLEQNIQLIEQFAMETLVNHGMIADINVHYDDENNPHVHIQMTTRKLKLLASGEVVFGDKGREWGRREFLHYYRENAAIFINQHLEKYGHLSQVSHLSHKDRGIDLTPSIHEGSAWRIKESKLKLENQQIIKENAARIYANPELAFDKLSINKPVFTKEDIAKALSTALYDKVKFNDNEKASLEELNQQSLQEFLPLYAKALASDKISIVVEEDLKGRTLYALTKRLELEERYKETVHALNSSKTHSLNITEESLAKPLAAVPIKNKVISLLQSSILSIVSNIGSNFLGNQATDKATNQIEQSQTPRGLSQEQRKAVLNILNGASISILEGLPGTGKTYVMKEIVAQYQKAGYRVIGTATSAAASLNLASMAGIEAKNISLWRKEWQEANGKEFELALRADYYKEPQYQNNKSILTSKDILIIDEAAW